MKIAIYHELPITTGSRKSLNEIAKYLSKKNQIDLYYIDSKHTERNKKYYNKIYFFKFIPVKWNGKNWKTRLYRDTLELLKLYFLNKKIAAIIEKKRYDILFIHASYLTESPFLLRFKNNTKVYYAHSPNYTLVFEKVVGIPKNNRLKYIYEKTNRFIRKFIDKGNVSNADFILANSNYTKKRIKEFYRKKSDVAYLGVDTNIYKPRKVKKNIDVLLVGSFEPADGYPLLQRAIGLIGKEINVRVLAAENEWISDEKKMANLYNQSKIVVCLSYGEPFGLVAIEAMASGVPVIAVDEAGYKETVVPNITGLLIPRKPKVLAASISSLLKDNKRRENYGKAGRLITLKQWSWEERAKKMEEFMERQVAKK